MKLLKLRVVSIACLAALNLGAATVPRLDLKELAQGSAVTVHGRILRQWCAWDPEHRFIWTHSQVAVHEVFKGGPYATITISEPGGTLDGLSMQVSGAVRFANGEEVVVFLHDTPLRYWRVYGWNQGKYHFAPAAGKDIAAFKARLRQVIQ